MTIADQVRRLIAQHLGIDAGRVTDEALFRDDLGADSLDAFELLMTFEDAFGLKIPDAAADPMQRVSDATAYIEAQVVGSRAGHPERRATDPETRDART